MGLGVNQSQKAHREKKKQNGVISLWGEMCSRSWKDAQKTKKTFCFYLPFSSNEIQLGDIIALFVGFGFFGNALNPKE